MILLSSYLDIPITDNMFRALQRGITSAASSELLEHVTQRKLYFSQGAWVLPPVAARSLPLHLSHTLKIKDITFSQCYVISNQSKYNKRLNVYRLALTYFHSAPKTGCILARRCLWAWSCALPCSRSVTRNTSWRNTRCPYRASSGTAQGIWWHEKYQTRSFPSHSTVSCM